MTSAAPSTAWLTPPQVAEQLAVDPSKVIVWIKRGELVAVNLASRIDGRARYRISAEALGEFLRRRTATPTARPTRSRRRRETTVTEFF